jgi:hypothetical protein
MTIRSTTHRLGAIIVATAALTSLTGVAQAASTKPSQMTKSEYRALTLRSEALNQQYRLGEWKGVPAGMTPPEYRALVLRGEAMNKQYGLGRWSGTTAVRAPLGSSPGFAWEAFGIGAVAMLGALLLTGGVIAARRYTRDAPRVRTS